MPDPARAMSKEDALAELERLATRGRIKLDGHACVNTVGLLGFDPVTGEDRPGNVAGVVLRDGNQNNVAIAPARLDPRNALALVRFCRFLTENFNVTELFHLGLDGGGHTADGVARTDCHGQGRALDFAGVTMPVGDVNRRITVLNHWGTVATSSTPEGEWPAFLAAEMHYRLDDPDASPLGDPDGDMFVADFFRSVYDFVAGEWQDRSDGADPADTPTAIGERSLILHPDHPATSPAAPGRIVQRNHIHMQIGKSGTE
ncbi:hypothetical protein [Nocardia sp. NPDC052566]|uniref:hypothetical protein n=1 Tax=Nocardia sp. NPDC052566 TaxID=3364330 RepID=UPI0037CA2A10